jgi:hypothetical protein
VVDGDSVAEVGFVVAAEGEGEEGLGVDGGEGEVGLAVAGGGAAGEDVQAEEAGAVPVVAVGVGGGLGEIAPAVAGGVEGRGCGEGGGGEDLGDAGIEGGIGESEGDERGVARGLGALGDGGGVDFGVLEGGGVIGFHTPKSIHPGFLAFGSQPISADLSRSQPIYSS